MKDINHIILGSIHQLLDWMLIEYLRVGLALGMEGELADIKEMVNFKELTEEKFITLTDLQLNIELLNSLQTKEVDLLRDYMNLISECKENFRLINEIEPADLLCDEEVVDQASDLYSNWFHADSVYGGVQDILQGIEQLHWDGTFMLYLCVVMIKRNTLEVWEGEDPFHEYCDAYDEIRLEASEDKNIRLLYGLLNQLDEQNELWTDHTAKYLKQWQDIKKE